MRRTKQITGILLSLILLMGIFTPVQLYATGTEPNSNGAGAEGNSNDAGTGAAGNTAKSGDNSLSTLTISPGTLSPAFQYNNTNYTASVDADVTSVTVDAKTSNANAVVESVSGNTDLKQGQNTISIVVKAENGAVATYKIVVTRAAGGTDSIQSSQGAEEAGETPADASKEETPADISKEDGENPTDTSKEDGKNPTDTSKEGTLADTSKQTPDGITLNGHTFNLAAAIPEDVIPQDFTKTTVNCQGQKVEGLSFGKGTLTLVYLTTPSTEVKNTLAVYEEAGSKFYQFRKIALSEETYLIVLDPPEETGLSEAYTKTNQSIGGYENVPSFVQESSAGTDQEEERESEDENESSKKKEKTKKNDGFSLVYAVSSFGNTGWYQYDGLESTFQRYVSKADASQAKDQGKQPSEEPSIEMQGLQNAYKDLEAQYNKKKEVSRKTTAVMIFVIAVLVIVVGNLLIRGRKNDEEEPDDGPVFEESKPRVRKRFWRNQEFDQKEEEFEQYNSEEDWQEKGRMKPKVRKRAQMEEEWEEYLWAEETDPKATVSQQTKPMYKSEKKRFQAKPTNRPEKITPSSSEWAPAGRTAAASPQRAAATPNAEKKGSSAKKPAGASKTTDFQARASMGKSQTTDFPGKGPVAANPNIQGKESGKKEVSDKNQEMPKEQNLQKKPMMSLDADDDFEIIDLEDL